MKRSLRLACLGLGSVIFALSCSDAKPVPAPVRPDAGVECELGTSGCGCDPITGCNLGLLCISRRCLPTEGGQGGVPNDSEVPNLPGYGGDGPTLENDAGSTPIVDASTDAAVAEPDSGAAPAPAPDAGDGG
ncbi:MAG: hypothetical protein ABW217_00095 [Polyangiaceae bacterium]